MSQRVFPYLWLPLAGFVLGWWIRGVPAGKDEEPQSRDVGSGAAGAVSRAEESVASGKGSRRVNEEAFTESDRRREAADRERMREVSRRTLELRLAEWQRELGLTAAEVAKLHAAIGPAIDRAEPPVAELALPAFEEDLLSMLEGARLAAFEQLGLRKEEALAKAKVEARLAEISAVLMLSTAQQGALREVLAVKAQELPDPSRPAAPGLSPLALAEVNRRLAARNDDGSGFLAITAEVIREEIEADMAELQPILTPDQLEAYRSHREESNARWLPSPP